ncbi:hypothetical protein ACP70R_015300 [Stipagrostis hirtigluma subsp. patula]
MTPPQLVEDAVGEILLRLPPDDPACLVRAAAVCTAWRAILADPAFSVRYRAFHRTAPVVRGVLRNLPQQGLARFIPTSSFRPSTVDHRNREVLDCRHGRVLLRDISSWDLVVWDPITGDQHGLPTVPEIGFLMFCNAAVLCAAAGCDHHGCHGGPFLVAFVATSLLDGGRARACLYSSVTGYWSAPTFIDATCFAENQPAALVGDALYFFVTHDDDNFDCLGILQYDLVGRHLTKIDPPDIYYDDGIAIMPAEDGNLGFAGLECGTLCMWRTAIGPNGDAEWEEHKTIDLETLLPEGNHTRLPYFIGFADVDGANIIYVNTEDGLFTIELNSLSMTKVCENYESHTVFPFMSFYTPAFASGRPSSPEGIQG